MTLFEIVIKVEDVLISLATISISRRTRFLGAIYDLENVVLRVYLRAGRPNRHIPGYYWLPLFLTQNSGYYVKHTGSVITLFVRLWQRVSSPWRHNTDLCYINDQNSIKWNSDWSYRIYVDWTCHSNLSLPCIQPVCLILYMKLESNSADYLKND
jgi:hypothetical protein